MATKKTWQQKLNSDKTSKVKYIDFDFADIPANSNMFIATPLLIDAYVNHISKGKKVSVPTMRKDLALENKANYTCPVTTGIFLSILAEASFEKYQKNNSIKGITPFWRVIDPNSAIAKKLSFGQEFLIEQRKKEAIDNY